MKSIYKYAIPVKDSFMLDLPKGAEILTIQTQSERPCLWALVDPENEKFIRCFQIFGTGHPISDLFQGTYVGAFQLDDGRLVFHVFEVVTNAS